MPELRIGEITHMWETSRIILSWVSFSCTTSKLKRLIMSNEFSE